MLKNKSNFTFVSVTAGEFSLPVQLYSATHTKTAFLNAMQLVNNKSIRGRVPRRGAEGSYFIGMFFSPVFFPLQRTTLTRGGKRRMCYLN